MNNLIPYKFIAIEGNIGAGKTTLSKMLAQTLNANLILEEFADNPFLPYFYKDKERYAFSVELFFMAERHKQLTRNLGQQDIFKDFIISDYFFLKTLLFASKTLVGHEYKLFNRFFNILNNSFAIPELLVYLHRPINRLLENIVKRGRSYELNITNEYLEDIQNSYFDYFRSEPDIPILVIDVGDYDFIDNPENYMKILELLIEDYKPGVHHRKLD